MVHIATGEISLIKSINKISVAPHWRLFTTTASSSAAGSSLLSIPSLISSPPLKQATHLVSFLLVLSPLPRSNKGANHYNWHPAGQLSQLGAVPLAEVWTNRGEIQYAVCYLYSLVKATRLVLSLQIIPHLTCH